jgi:hypothetical protein
MSEEPLCGKCGLPMHKDDARRYFGFYTAHMEDRCGTLLRAKIDDLEQKNVRLIDAIVRFHVKGDISEGQAAKATGLYRIDLRERADAIINGASESDEELVKGLEPRSGPALPHSTSTRRLLTGSRRPHRGAGGRERPPDRLLRSAPCVQRRGDGRGGNAGDRTVCG